MEKEKVMIAEKMYGLAVGLVLFFGLWTVVLLGLAIFWIAKAAFLEVRFLFVGEKALKELTEVIGADYAPWWRREFAIYVGFTLMMALAIWWDVAFPGAHFYALTLFFLDFVFAGAAIWSLGEKGVEYHSAQLSLVLQKHDEQ